MRLSLTCFILTFRNAEYLARAAASVAAQTRRPDRTLILVMDNLRHSMTAGREQAARFGFEYRTSPPPIFSHATGKNVAAAMSKTDCFMLLDGDDWLEAEYVAACMARMEAGGNQLAAVGTDYCWDGAQTGQAMLPPIERADLANPLPSCAVIRHAAFESAFGFRDMLNDDWQLWKHLVSLGYALDRVPRVLFHYFRHAASLSARKGHPK